MIVVGSQRKEERRERKHKSPLKRIPEKIMVIWVNGFQSI